VILVGLVIGEDHLDDRNFVSDPFDVQPGAEARSIASHMAAV